MNPNKYLAEFLGTMILMLSVLVSGGQPLVVGGALAVIIYFAGSMGAGQVNPAITVAAFIAKKLSLQDLTGYIIAQLLGAVSSVYLYKFVLTLA
jgi:aquaporin Z